MEFEMLAGIGIGLYLLSVYIFAMGFSSLKDSKNHEEYGVQNQSLHKKFSFFLIFLSIIIAALATFMVFK
ncbi:hypothetical protein AKN88_06125 [Thiopseudomonas alkaliphila]|uniref:Uncharacterized protein n=1 Tax=Thiopseudomonas alkaliphila TaxID=1697053 RepID=A0A0K1XE85_9GAMM|nr:hypothetical protein [Thiopseudomonas alkaliphila]AKX59549.1 hypothetical protein AKN88_06125 [Thiopseudomonas alkaliphila]